MIEIVDIRAFPIKSEMLGAHFKEGPGAMRTAPRRPPWTRDAEVAGPLSGYPRFKKHRSTWRFDGSVGCLVTASDGTTGFGVTRHGRPVVALINDHLGPLIRGEKALATERLWDMMMRAAAPYGSGGLAAYAISAVDLALWDLKGKILRQPVYALAGGPTRDDVFCYATGNDTAWNMELGFRATKLACPYGPADGLEAIHRNEALVAATRDLIGPDVELMLDCWLAHDVEFTVRLAERLKPYGLRWIEDPILPDDLDAHAALRARLPSTTIATGEHWYLPATFLQAAARRLADIFQPDVAWAGGFTGCRRIDAVAEAAGIEVILHAGMNTPYGQHLTFASTNMRWGEYFIGGATGVPLEETLVFPGMAVPRNGRLTPNDEPGFGLGLTPALLDALCA